MEFAEESYDVYNKNDLIKAVLKLKYPGKYNESAFPINGTVEERKGVNDSANGKILFLHMAKHIASCICYITVQMLHIQLN